MDINEIASRGADYIVCAVGAVFALRYLVKGYKIRKSVLDYNKATVSRAREQLKEGNYKGVLWTKNFFLNEGSESAREVYGAPEYITPWTYLKTKRGLASLAKESQRALDKKLQK